MAVESTIYSDGLVRTAVLTVSTAVSRREADDKSGQLLAERAEAAGAEIVAMEVVPDDYGLIEDRIRHYVDAGDGTVTLTAEARATARTGVEMEALTAASIAALTVYDMVKGLEQGVEIASVALLEKTGGKADYRRA